MNVRHAPLCSLVMDGECSDGFVCESFLNLNILRHCLFNCRIKPAAHCSCVALHLQTSFTFPEHLQVELHENSRPTIRFFCKTKKKTLIKSVSLKKVAGMKCWTHCRIPFAHLPAALLTFSVRGLNAPLQNEESEIAHSRAPTPLSSTLATETDTVTRRDRSQSLETWFKVL